MSTTTQNDVTNALTAAIQTIAESNVQSKEATLVVEAEIVDIIDEGLGIYTVKYLGNKFEATTANTEIIYEINDIVYVIIPNGNFDKNKIILSPVVPSEAVYATAENNTYHITIGDNLFKYISDVSLCTYKPHDKEEVDIDTTGFSALFKSALADSRIFNFTCKIQTNIERDRRTKGNYGLVLEIPVIQSVNGEDSQKYYSFTVDTNNIIGDPYDLSVPSLQNFYFTLPEDMRYDDTLNPKIKSFIYNFIGEDDTKPDDVFITNIELLPILEVDKETMSGYYSVITASNGNSFLASRTGDTKTLTVTAYLNGKITKINNFDCYWFKENVSIDTTSDKYQHYGGLGWEILNKVSEKNIAEDGKINYQYVTNVYTQTVLQEEIHCDTKFKCILVKNNKIISSIVTIKNLASDAKIELTSINGSNVFSSGVGNVNLQLKYYESGITDVSNPTFVIGYSWQRLDKKGNYIDNDFYTIDEFNKREDNTYYTKIHYPVDEIDEINTISCTVYIDTPSEDGKMVKRQIIGTTSLMVFIGEPSVGHIVVANGDKIFKYDADGDSPLVADYDGPLSSTIKTIDPISIKVYKEDGTELTEDEYKVTDISWLVPINSMIKLSAEQKTDTTTNPGYYTIKNKYLANYELSYSISNSYSKTKMDNTIIIQADAPVSVLKERVSGVANIRFLKDGEGGTNGSKYSAILTYNGYGYGEKDSNGKINKLQLVYVDDINTWYLYNPALPNTYLVFESAQLIPNLYVDGDKVNDVLSTVKWNIFDNSYFNTSDKIQSPIDVNGGIITLNGNNWENKTNNFCATIEAKIPTIRNSLDTNSEEYVYAYYPIECSYIAKSSYLESFVPTLEGGYFKVLYASDGTNPQYDNSENFYVVDSSYNDSIEDLYNYLWSGSENIKISDNTSSTCKATPLSKYDNGVAKNFVRVDITRDTEETRILREKRDNLNNERLDIIYKKDYYVTLQDNLKVFKDFYYNSYVNRLTNCADFYNLKTALIKTIEQLLNQINTLSSLCNEYKEKDDGSIDTDVVNLYNETLEKITILNNLNNLCNKLGAYPNIINSIQEITLDNLTIVNKIEYEGTPDRNCYFTINDDVDSYNTTVNFVYASYLDILGTSEMAMYDTTIQEVVNELREFVSSSKLQNLTKTYNNHNEEAYRYIALIKVLEGRVNSISEEDADTYSYNLIIENVIDPIYDSLNWYISFYDDGGYESIIQELNENINALTDEITILDNMLRPENLIDIVHVKPIIMVYNRYELSNINGWDGNKLETGDGYIIAPQVGAGKKDDNNRFTGIVIGVKQYQEKITSGQKIGLFGYSEGAVSIFLNAEDGSATFGTPGKGQVIIEPKQNNAIIKSGNYVPNKTGMLIDLTTPEIKFGSGCFEVTKEGYITAKGGGEIAGWSINNTQIFKNKNSSSPSETTKITIDSGTIHEATSTSSKYTSFGIYSGSHDTITSTKPGFCLNDNGLSIGSKVYISNSGVMSLGAGAVSGSSGNHWTIDGGSESHISYNSTGFQNGSVYIGTDGISLGEDNFSVNRSGKLIAKTAEITGTSTLGKWKISDGKIVGESENGQITLDAEGDISASGGGSYWSISRNGDATFNHITCTDTWSFGKGDATWSNSGFNFGMKSGEISLGSLANGGFLFSGNGTSWGSGSKESFSGGGQASYSSEKANPFGGECVTHIKNLAVERIDATYILGEIANVNSVSVKGLACSGGLSTKTLSVSSTSTLNGVQNNGTCNLITGLSNRINDINKTWTGTCTVGGVTGTCSITISGI